MSVHSSPRRVVAALLAASGMVGLLAPSPAAGVDVIPAEPGAEIVTGAPTMQVAVADLDGDGAREVLALARDDRGALRLHAWAQRDEGWAPVAEPIEVVPEPTTPGQGTVSWAAAPVRLLVSTDAGSERVTLLRQPDYREDDLDEPCCLLIDDVRLADGRLRVEDAAPTTDSVSAAFVLDLDGDGTDELVTTTSLAPQGDIAYPTEVRVYVAAGTRFEDPIVTELPIGSGDTPIILGDSDGRPGEELGIAVTLGRPDFHRVAWRGDGTFSIEDAGRVLDAAVGVPIDGGGILIGADGGWGIHPWPALGGIGPPVASSSDALVTLLGVVRPSADGERGGAAFVTVAGGVVQRVELAPPYDVSVHPSTRAAPLPARGFRGPIPATPHDATWIVADGLAWDGDAEARPTAVFGEVRPIGFAGADDGFLVLQHGTGAAPLGDGGRLDAPVFSPGSAVAVVPVASALVAEEDGGIVATDLRDAVVYGTRGETLTGPGGFSVDLGAPPGTRVYVASDDPSVVDGVAVVPESGEVSVAVTVPAVSTPNPRYGAALAAVTPGGHTYGAGWVVQVLADGPSLMASGSTTIGSGAVTIRGRTEAYAAVSVAGRAVEVDATGRFTGSADVPPWPTDVTVEAVDPLGNRTVTTVSAIGWLDYRGLPWIPIGVVLVALTAVTLFLRVPRLRSAPRSAADDGTLEELDPEG